MMENDPTAELVALVPDNAVRFVGHGTHTHSVPHLIHVVTGSAQIVAAGESIRLGLQENLWLAAEVPHSARYAPGSLVLGPFLSPQTTPSQAVQRLGRVPSVSKVLRTSLGVAPKTDREIRPFRLALDAILRDIRDRAHFTLPLPAHPTARKVARCATTTLTLDELATAHGVSARHIQRLFLNETGMTFSRWRTRARLNIAIASLRGGDDLTAAVANIAGYTTRSGLIRAFSRELGVSEQMLASDTLGALELVGEVSSHA